MKIKKKMKVRRGWIEVRRGWWSCVTTKYNATRQIIRCRGAEDKGREQRPEPFFIEKMYMIESHFSMALGSTPNRVVLNGLELDIHGHKLVPEEPTGFLPGSTPDCFCYRYGGSPLDMFVSITLEAPEWTVDNRVYWKIISNPGFPFRLSWL